MLAWEYQMYAAGFYDPKILRGRINVSKLWTREKKNVKSPFEVLLDFGNAGWEIISVMPITEASGSQSYTSGVLYTLKRPKQQV